MVYIKNEDIPIYFRIFTFAILLSQFADIIWIMLYFKVNTTQDFAQGDIFKFVVLIFSLLNFAVKFVCAAVLWKNSIDLS